MVGEPGCQDRSHRDGNGDRRKPEARDIREGRFRRNAVEPILIAYEPMKLTGAIAVRHVRRVLEEAGAAAAMPATAIGADDDQLLAQPFRIAIADLLRRNHDGERLGMDDRTGEPLEADGIKASVDPERIAEAGLPGNVGSPEVDIAVEILLAGRAAHQAARRVDELVQAVGLEGHPAQLAMKLDRAGLRRHVVLEHRERRADVGSELLELGDVLARVRAHGLAHLMSAEDVEGAENGHEDAEPQPGAEQALMRA